jgi:rhodanese-related sulfurtransferase
MDKARDLAPTVSPRRDAPIVVYCASETCKNSHEVAKLLTSVGYTDVRVYVGGKADWQAAGLPLE